MPIKGRGVNGHLIRIWRFSRFLYIDYKKGEVFDGGLVDGGRD